MISGAIRQNYGIDDSGPVGRKPLVTSEPFGSAPSSRAAPRRVLAAPLGRTTLPRCPRTPLAPIRRMIGRMLAA
jgi:hypothetical protein